MGVKSLQATIGVIYYYSHASNNKLLVALSAIVSQQEDAIEATADPNKKVLDYVAVYSNYGMVYCTSDMVLAAHSEPGFQNELKGRSRAGAHIFLFENDPEPI